MLKFRSLLILSLLIFALSIKADVIIYKSYDSYKKDIGERYDDYKSYYHTNGNVKLKFLKDGKKVKINCKDIWGFKYNDVLFRIDKRHTQPTRVISVGKICYYENGVAHLQMMKKNTTEGNFSVGYYCYVSKNLNSELIPMPGSLISDARKKIKRFKAANSQYKKLFDCIEKNYHYKNVRPCVEAFEKEE